VRETILISKLAVIKLAVRGANTPLFGNLNAKIFDTRDEALAYCRAQLAEKERRSRSV